MTKDPSWGEAIVEGSLEWSFLQVEDLPELADLCAAIEYFDDPTELRSLEDLQADYALPFAYAHRHAVVGRDRGGTIVAYAWNHVNPPDSEQLEVWLEIGVHPAWRYHKIGLKLVGWSINRARTWYRHIKERRPDIGPLWVGCAVDEDLRLAEDFRDDGQLEAERWFFDAHRPLLDPPIPQYKVPDEVTLVKFDTELSEQVRLAHNIAFSTRVGSQDVSSEDWQASLNRPDFRPDWSWVAICAEEPNKVVGYALNSEFVDAQAGIRQGWTERFGVRPRFRHSGIGKALLAASMLSFQSAGCALAGIGVDTDAPDRASQLFKELDYILDDKMVLFGARFFD